MIKEKHRVTKIDGDTRINDYLVDVFHSLPSKKSIKKALKKGLIQVDGKSVSSALWVKSNMEICLLEDQTSTQNIYDLEIEVVFEDEFIAIVNKPAGVVSSGNQFRTLQNALLGNLKPSNQKDAIHPKLVHRLDSVTSGLVIIAKTAQSALLLGNLLAEKKINKLYHAFVIGELEAEGMIESKIEDKEAITKYKRLDSQASTNFGKITSLELSPVTGRTHQLRIHMVENGNPILGERLYGDVDNNLKGKGLFLCAKKVEFDHPITSQRLLVEIPLPKKFEKYWSGLIKRNSDSL